MAVAATGGGVLLLVEDDDAIGRLVKQYLEQQGGWRVLWLRTGEEAVAELRRHPVRLVVLDVGLPGINAILRRAEPSSHDAVLTAGEIVLRRDSHDVTVDGEPVQLTAKEFDLL